MSGVILSKSIELFELTSESITNIIKSLVLNETKIFNDRSFSVKRQTLRSRLKKKKTGYFLNKYKFIQDKIDTIIPLNRYYKKDYAQIVTGDCSK